MTAEFNQIKRNEHLPSKVATHIAREIAEGRIGPGEKLPTEHILARTFGVSRSVVREAIAQLRNEELVETRQGVGAFATGLKGRPAIRIERGELEDGDSFRSLFQLRMPLEIEAAGLAALHHTESDMAKLDAALGEMTGGQKWTEQGILADVAFHRAIAGATGNDYFLMFIGFLAERVGLTINAARARAVLEEIVEATIAEHVAIRDAVASHDPLKAREAMRRHLQGAASRLDLKLEQF